MLPRRVRGKEGDVHKKGSMEHGRNDAGTRRNGETEIGGQKSDDRGQKTAGSLQLTVDGNSESLAFFSS